MVVSLNNSVVNVLAPRYVGEEISIAIDSSKSNTAIAIGDANCNLKDYLELNGENDGTSEQDVLILCKKHREALSTFLRGSKPVIVGIEDIITKKDDETKYSGGITHHMSRFKITAVFMSLICFFQDTFDITPELVNNNTWKSTVLPPEFCKRNIGKGSLAYFKSINSPLQYCRDDVTDAVCILECLRIEHGLSRGYQITELEIASHEYQLCFIHPDRQLKNEVKFIRNKEFSWKQNADVMANHISEGDNGVVLIPTSEIPIGDIYQYCTGKFPEVTKELKLLVRRK